MGETGANVWTDNTSVLLTSFWGWTPETWGTVGWTGDRGRTRRANLLKGFTDPFITVIYVTSNKGYIESGLRGKIAGFYLVTHEIGDRDQFTHPGFHSVEPEKWRHSLRAVRAFTFHPEHRIDIRDLDPTLPRHARHVAAMGTTLTDPAQIRRLRDTPRVEVACYSGTSGGSTADDPWSDDGRVKAGPASRDGYVVSSGTHQLQRDLYVLRLTGDTEAYLGEPCGGRTIYKIGLSVSPDLRRQSFQKAMLRGAFRWRVDRTSTTCGFGRCVSFDAAVAGEDAMKRHLAKHATWLGGEFYLATEAQIDEAWQRGHAAADSYVEKA